MQIGSQALCDGGIRDIVCFDGELCRDDQAFLLRSASILSQQHFTTNDVGMFKPIWRSKWFSITIGENNDATTKGTWGKDIQNYLEERSIAKTRGKTLNENFLWFVLQHVFTGVLKKARLPAPSCERKIKINLGIVNTCFWQWTKLTHVQDGFAWTSCK